MPTATKYLDMSADNDPALNAANHGVDASSLELTYKRIRGAILSNELEPGAILSQVKLAKVLGVSRTPLREALRLLQYEGLVEAEHNKRVRISALSHGDLEQLYALRIANEAVAVRASLPRMNSIDDRRLQTMLNQMSALQKQGDVDGWEQVHRDFHHELIFRAGPRTAKLIDELSEHAERYRRTFITQIPRAWSAGEAEHAAIVAACVARDGREAAALLARHLGRTALSLLMFNAPEYEPSIVRAAIRAFTDLA